MLAGLVGFTAASLWCGLGGSGTELVLARAGQGAFANISFYLLITLNMQNQLASTPLQSGATVVPVAIVFSFVSRGAGPWAQTPGTRDDATGGDPVLRSGSSGAPRPHFPW